MQGRGESENARRLDRRDQCSLCTCINESSDIDNFYVNKMNVKIPQIYTMFYQLHPSQLSKEALELTLSFPWQWSLQRCFSYSLDILFPVIKGGTFLHIVLHEWPTLS